MRDKIKTWAQSQGSRKAMFHHKRQCPTAAFIHLWMCNSPYREGEGCNSCRHTHRLPDTHARRCIHTSVCMHARTDTHTNTGKIDSSLPIKNQRGLEKHIVSPLTTTQRCWDHLQWQISILNHYETGHLNGERWHVMELKSWDAQSGERQVCNERYSKNVWISVSVRIFSCLLWNTCFWLTCTVGSWRRFSGSLWWGIFRSRNRREKALLVGRALVMASEKHIHLLRHNCVRQVKAKGQGKNNYCLLVAWLCFLRNSHYQL